MLLKSCLLEYFLIFHISNTLISPVPESLSELIYPPIPLSGEEG